MKVSKNGTTGTLTYTIDNTIVAALQTTPSVPYIIKDAMWYAKGRSRDTHYLVRL